MLEPNDGRGIWIRKYLVRAQTAKPFDVKSLAFGALRAIEDFLIE